MVDLVVIGMTKSGSTWVDSILRQNSHFSLPKNIKETNFFSQNYHLSIDWYENLFDDNRICVEVCPNYARDKIALERIRLHYPEARVLLLLREPFSRIESHINHYRRTRLHTNSTLDDILAKYPEIQQDSNYIQVINDIKSVFAVDKFDILLFEDITKEFAVFSNYIQSRFSVGVDLPLRTEKNSFYDTRFKFIYTLLRKTSYKLNLKGINLKTPLLMKLIQAIFDRKTSAIKTGKMFFPKELRDFLEQQNRIYKKYGKKL